jgi:ATP-dependent Clp protease ATP-binding subunit ClpA
MQWPEAPGWPVMSRLSRAAFQEAVSFRHAWVGGEHLLIALMKLDEESAGREALRALGVDKSLAMEHLANIEYVPSIGAGQTPTLSPHYFTLLGLARAFASAGRSNVALPEHLLLAFIWYNHEPNMLVDLLQRVGHEPDALQTSLARLGVQTPSLN